MQLFKRFTHRFLRTRKVLYRVHESTSLDPIPSQLNPVYILIFYFLKICFKTILPSMPASPKWSINFTCEFVSPACMLLVHSRFILLDLINLNTFRKEDTWCSSSVCNPFVLLLLLPSQFHTFSSALFSNYFNLWASSYWHANFHTHTQ